jgi:hypothetical protein
MAGWHLGRCIEAESLVQDSVAKIVHGIPSLVSQRDLDLQKPVLPNETGGYSLWQLAMQRYQSGNHPLVLNDGFA